MSQTSFPAFNWHTQTVGKDWQSHHKYFNYKHKNLRAKRSLATIDISPAAIDTQAYSLMPAELVKLGGRGGANLADNGGSSDETT